MRKYKAPLFSVERVEDGDIDIPGVPKNSRDVIGAGKGWAETKGMQLIRGFIEKRDGKTGKRQNVNDKRTYEQWMQWLKNNGVSASELAAASLDIGKPLPLFEGGKTEHKFNGE